MARTWFCSDHHFGHSNIIKFLDKDGSRIRPFDSIQEHDEMIIKYHNDVVRPEDRVYIMGDLAMARKDIQTVSRLMGRKILIRGNHDIFKLDDYLPYFDDIVSMRVYPKENFIVTHIPIHPNQLGSRWRANVHGHLHSNLVLQHDSMVPDPRYISMCMEKIDFRPVEFSDLLKRIKMLPEVEPRTRNLGMDPG